MNEGEYEAYQDRIDEAFELLREHFDTAFIIASRYEGEIRRTYIWTRDMGDMYSIERQVQEWLEEDHSDALYVELEIEDGDSETE